MRNRSELHADLFKALVIVCLAAVLVLLHHPIGASSAELLSLSVRSEDGALAVRWETSLPNDDFLVHIVIDQEGEVRYDCTVEADSSPLLFTEGEHGAKYTVSASPAGRFGQRGKEFRKEALFLDYSELSGLPLLVIDTESGQDPTYKLAEKPREELFGNTITLNPYLPAALTVLHSTERTDASVRIRVRGNTSTYTAAPGGKVPYRIELENALDLLERGEEYARRHWVLLLGGNTLNTFVGEAVAEYCGIAFQTHGTFVNLILNGDYKGCYYLSEAVEAETSDGLVGETGCLFESDPYFWAEREYFRPEWMGPYFGITVKFPHSLIDDEELYALLCFRIQEAEDLLASDDPSFAEKLDVPSCAAWLLAHDFLGGNDFAGSNRFFYLDNLQSGKICMGPLWDFDETFYKDTFYDAGDTGLPFHWLLQNSFFNEQYYELFSRLSGGLPAHFSVLLNELEEQSGAALDKSWQLDSTRWNVSNRSFRENKCLVLTWFHRRVLWMQAQLEQPIWQGCASTDCLYSDNLYYDLNDVTPAPRGSSLMIRGWAFPGVGLNGRQIILLEKDGIFRSVRTVPRPDVQEYFDLSSDNVGFIAVVESGEYNLCVLDPSAGTIYRSHIIVSD